MQSRKPMLITATIPNYTGVFVCLLSSQLIAPDEDGYAYAGIINDELHLGCYLKYKTDTLPLLIHWKNMCAHDYVIGLKPSNS